MIAVESSYLTFYLSIFCLTACALAAWPFRKHSDAEAQPVDEPAPEAGVGPGEADDLIEWGLRLGALGKPDIAAQRFMRAAEFRPADPTIQYNLGLALDLSSGSSGAIAAYTRATQIAPNFAEAHTNLGAAMIGTGDLAGAVRELERAAALAPDDLEIAYSLGCAYLSVGDFRKAVDQLRRVLRNEPEDAEARFNLAIALLGGGWSDLAEIEFEAFLKIAGDRFPEQIAYAQRALGGDNGP